MKFFNKSQYLLNKVDNFYQKSLQRLSNLNNYQFNLFHKLAQKFEEFENAPLSHGPSQSLLDQAEQFDIKDEDLFIQFENFMESYKDLMDTLTIDPEQLTPETLEDAGQLIDNLNTRYQRIQNNPYLNMNEEQGWDEDFDPADLTEFVQKVVQDASKQLNAVAGEEINVSDLVAQNIANEFSDNRNIDKGDQNIRWTGNKIQQQLQARRAAFEKLMFIKKVGPTHPDYDRYQNYINTRKEQYQTIMSNPERKDKYFQKANERHKKYRAFDERKNKLQALINQARGKEQDELKKKFERINELETKYQQRTEKRTQTIQTKKQTIKDPGGSRKNTYDLTKIKLDGWIEHIKIKLIGERKTVKDKVLDKLTAEEHSLFKPYLDAIATASNNKDKSALLNAVKSLDEKMKEVAKSDPTFTDYVISIRSSKFFYGFRDKLKELETLGIDNDNKDLNDNEKSKIKETINNGQKLIDFYRKLTIKPIGGGKERKTHYKAPTEWIGKIVEYLGSLL